MICSKTLEGKIKTKRCDSCYKIIATFRKYLLHTICEGFGDEGKEGAVCQLYDSM